MRLSIESERNEPSDILMTLFKLNKLLMTLGEGYSEQKVEILYELGDIYASNWNLKLAYECYQKGRDLVESEFEKKQTPARSSPKSALCNESPLW